MKEHNTRGELNNSIISVIFGYLIECDASGMRITTSNSEVMVLSQKRVAHSLHVRDELRHLRVFVHK